MSVPVAARSKVWVCTAGLKKLRVRTPPDDWLCVSCKYCVFTGRGLCEGPIPVQRIPTKGDMSE